MPKLTSLYAIAALMLTSCCQFDRMDTESAVRAGVPIGTQLVAKKELVAMVVSESYRSNEIDFISVTEQPGYVGREVMRRVVIAKGHVFEVVGARESSSLGCRRRYIVVRSKEPIDPSSAEIWLWEEADATNRVNPALFEAAKE